MYILCRCGIIIPSKEENLPEKKGGKVMYKVIYEVPTAMGGVHEVEMTGLTLEQAARYELECENVGYKHKTIKY